ncbi:MAG: DNA polymerase III subunit chi [Porticoccaceae bacterium]|jgi:DNA polymerase-3 subunit chi
MTRVNFYQVSGGLDACRVVVAQLIGEALSRNLDILVRLDSATSAERLARDLDTLCQAPVHVGPAIAASRGVSLCWRGDPGPHHGLLINVAAGIPDWYSRFERLAELVYDQPGLVADKRASFRFYRDRGYPLRYHDLSRDLDLLHSA